MLTTWIRYTLPYALTLIACGCTTVYQYPRAQTVTFEIEVEGQWRELYRATYTYPDHQKELELKQHQAARKAAEEKK